MSRAEESRKKALEAQVAQREALAKQGAEQAKEQKRLRMVVKREVTKRYLPQCLKEINNATVAGKLKVDITLHSSDGFLEESKRQYWGAIINSLTESLRKDGYVVSFGFSKQNEGVDIPASYAVTLYVAW